MALGILNNLSAIYASHNLNNTSASLQQVLQQLSSGSRINSGADDAAGLSLVNGLQANQTALTQSATNATEGVGLLQVADGALAQVTNLLNRAVTLATEASNGTLNNSQATAANQEYQSILAEINNIGSTTTYNQNRVFSGTTVAVYTGDSSSTGASVDSLYFGQLDSSHLGDAGGTISYSSGSSVFLDLKGTTDAAAGDNLAATSTIDVSVLNADGSTTTTTVGGTSVQTLIQNINSSGLGLTATFATNGTDHGILIAGTFVGAGSNPTASGYHIGISNDATNPVKDSTTAQAAAAGIAAGPATPGLATIAYTSAGAAGRVSLANTNLNSTSNAQSALGLLNSAISAVASQDGYIGAQINTLTSISQVMTTQKENLTSAQNAIQATDYAAATSSLSKFQILTQTGIAALAQANSIQQQVTKLLQ